MTEPLSSKTCNKCHRSLAHDSVELWDAKWYCRPCVEDASAELYQMAVNGEPLEESITTGDVNPFRVPWLYMSAAPITATFFATIFLCAGETDFETLAIVFLALLLFGILFVGAAFGIGQIAFRWMLPHEKRIESGDFIVQDPSETKRIPLQKCEWLISRVYNGPVYFATGSRLCVSILAFDKLNYIGLTDQSRERWKAFLTLAGVSPVQPSGCVTQILLCLASVLFFGVAGITIGNIAAMFANHRLGAAACLFSGVLLGVVDGFIVWVIYFNFATGTEERRKTFNPLYVGLIAALLAGKATLGGAAAGIFSWPAAIAICLANGVFGAVVSWLCGAYVPLRELGKPTEGNE